MGSITMKRTVSLLLVAGLMMTLLTTMLPKAHALDADVIVPDFYGKTSEAADAEIGAFGLTALHDDFVPESEAMQVSVNEVVPYVSTCCEKMNVVRQTTEIWHIYQDPAGPCLSVAYFGYLYCTYCNTRYSDNVCYKQEGGCGSWHGISSLAA